MRRLFTLSVFVAFLGLSTGAAGQGAADPFEQGRQAYRQERYEEAERFLEQAAARDPGNAEVHYLLARLYTETPLRDRRKASQALDRALALRPDDVQYLVARLQALRTESSNFFSEKLKEAKRAQLARDILKLDPGNAFAHEELGTLYIHDFWRYRNAIALPFMQYELNPDERAELIALGGTESQDGTAAAAGGVLGSDVTFPAAGHLSDPHQVFRTDRFDLDVLEEMGVPVQDLSARAQRAYDQAIGHLGQALATDPRRRSVYDRMMEIYALKGAYQEALEMLEQMYVFFPEDPGLWTYLGLAHHRLGNLEATAKSFEVAFRHMTPDVAQAYQRLDDLLSEEERKQYAADPVRFAARFWTSKDPRYLTPYNERKLEHYARLTYADLLYGVPELDLRGWDTERGRILVRYGLPNTDVVIVPDETSRLARSVLHRVLTSRPPEQTRSGQARGDPLRGSSRTGFDLSGELNTFNIWDYGTFRFVFEDPVRNGAYRLYSPSASEIAAGVDAWRNDYTVLARETFRKVPERYTYEVPGRQIEIPYLANAFKGSEGEIDLYVHYGIPITSYDPAQAMIEVTANVGTFLISPQRDILVERRRTVYGLRTDQVVPFKETNLWVDTQQMKAPAGTHELSVELETASGATVAVQRRAVTVPDFAQPGLALSDLLLAYHVEETSGGAPRAKGDLVRHNLSITPAPWSVFSSSRPIYLYFEIYHLAQADDGRTNYDVEILLLPKDQGGGIGKLFKNLFGREKGVSLRFSGGGTTPDEGQYQVLDVGDSPPGLYTLQLRVRDHVARKTIETEKDLFLE